MFSKNELDWKEIGILIVLAYTFSFAIRLIWVWQFQDTEAFYWNNALMINTNDGYFFASAVEYLLNGSHADNPRVQIAINSYPGVVYVSYFLAKFTPMSLETAILYAPSIIASLVVIPIILTGILIRLPWVGFFAALLGSIAWSYYNRTMTGYYDSDMFSVLLQFTTLYLFLLTIYSKEKLNILLLVLFIVIYPFFYPQGLSIIYAIFVLWAIYQLVYQRTEANSYLFIVMASIALWTVPIWIKVLILVGLFGFFDKLKNHLDLKKLFYLVLFALFIFFLFGNVFNLIWAKLSIYTARGVEDSGLRFYQVIQTVREAGTISWEMVANRISGHPILWGLSIVGYILLVMKYKKFLIALPLIAIGILAHWAGLRFTVYAVPVFAFSLIYLFYLISFTFIKEKLKASGIFVVLSLLALYPNITHIIDYKVPTVLNKMEVQDLEKLDQIAGPKDYTLTWWDYGYPLWFYSDTSTLIDGGKHHNDNFIISKIMISNSQEQVANLSRLAVETYVSSNYKVVANELFSVEENPKKLLNALKSPSYKLPEKTRDIYLYLPYRMMRIFPTVATFGNLNLMTGKKERSIAFYPTRAVSQQRTKLLFANGITFDTQSGELKIGNQKTKVARFDITQYQANGKLKVDSNLLNMGGSYCVVYLKSYNEFIVMDKQTYESTYVQMFMLEKYDKELFELLVSSPYSKIYKVKR